jgi:hypothetical protein
MSDQSGPAEPIQEGFPDKELERELEIEERLRRMDNTSIGPDALRERFGYHKPTEFTQPMHQAVRGLLKDTASVLDRILPNGRAKFQAIIELELALMWANKAIAEMAPVEETGE